TPRRHGTTVKNCKYQPTASRIISGSNCRHLNKPGHNFKTARAAFSANVPAPRHQFLSATNRLSDASMPGPSHHDSTASKGHSHWKTRPQYRAVVQIRSKYRGSVTTLVFGKLKPH